MASRSSGDEARSDSIACGGRGQPRFSGQNRRWHMPSNSSTGMYAGQECLGRGIALLFAGARRWLRNGARMRRNDCRTNAGSRHAHRWHRALGRLREADDRVEPYKNRGQRGKTVLLHQPASSQTSGLARLYPDNPIILDHVLRVIRLQQRCNLDSRGNGAYTSFPSYLRIGEADGDAPV